MPHASIFAEPNDRVKNLLQRSAANDISIAGPAQLEIAKALELPLRQGIMAGNITDGIFAPMLLAPGAAPEFPLDILTPGQEKEHVAYTIPYHGRIPEHAIEGDYIMVSTYE